MTMTDDEKWAEMERLLVEAIILAICANARPRNWTPYHDARQKALKQDARALLGLPPLATC